MVRHVAGISVSLLCLHLASAATSIRAEAAETLSPRQAYSATRSDPVTHDVEFVITVTPPYHCKVLKVWVPVPQTDAGQAIAGSRFSTFPETVEPQLHREPEFGNCFAYFEFHDPQGAQIIRHHFQAKVWNLTWRVDPEAVTQIESWPSEFARYLRLQTLDRPQDAVDLLNTVVPRRQGPGSDLIAAMSWIDQHLSYDHVHASLRADANHALRERRGHCSDYHGLCATLGRLLGSPTQVTYGLHLYPKNSPSHCKLEAFLPPYGWVSFDLSETQQLVRKIEADPKLSESERQALAAAARQRLQSGFRENSWLLLTRGTDYELVPRASQPVRVVRTAYVEADGEPLPDPDPANAEKREFAWMTAHRFSSDRPFRFPFSDYATLATE